MQCEHHVEFLNVKPGGTRNNRQDLKRLMIFRYNVDKFIKHQSLGPHIDQVSYSGLNAQPEGPKVADKTTLLTKDALNT
jgi:hypothetical protein